jgi:hypothetical protein
MDKICRGFVLNELTAYRPDTGFLIILTGQVWHTDDFSERNIYIL